MGIGILIVFSGINSFDFEPVHPVTQQDLRIMIDEWMNSPDRNNLEPRLEIMKAYYTFEESDKNYLMIRKDV